jgi:hypothetical protein
LGCEKRGALDVPALRSARPSPAVFGMLSRRICTFALVCVSAMSVAMPGLAAAQQGGAPTQNQLDEVSSRGRALAGYQRAAWTASAQLLATNPDPWKVQRYVAYHADSGWVVAFGRLSTDRDTFYVSHIGIPAARNGQRVDTTFEFQLFAQPGPDTDFLVRAARAMDLAVLTFGVTARSYSAAAIPNENGDWFVYLIPSADAANVWPLGDDVRYRVSGDGRRVLETRRMHEGMMEGARRTSTEASRSLMGKHGKSPHDLPEDSDVFHVLMGHPSLAEVVVTRHHQYVIGVDGSIKLLQGKETVVGATR